MDQLFNFASTNLETLKPPLYMIGGVIVSYLVLIQGIIIVKRLIKSSQPDFDAQKYAQRYAKYLEQKPAKDAIKAEVRAEYLANLNYEQELRDLAEIRVRYANYNITKK